MIHVGTRESFKNMKCWSHFPAMIVPSTSDSITISSQIITSSRDHSIKLGTTIVLFSRSFQFRRLLEMGVAMILFTWYIRPLYFCYHNSQIFHFCHTVEERYPGKLYFIPLCTFDSKSTQNCREQINSLSISAAFVLYSWRSDSICSRTLISVCLFLFFSYCPWHHTSYTFDKYFYETNDYGHQAHRDISAYW
jgi:hypothetical protein